ATNRTGGQFKEVDRAVRHATLRVERAMPKTERSSGARDLGDHCFLCLAIERRRRDVDRFFEEWAVEWIGLVEDGKCLQLAARQHPFDGKFAAANEAFDQNRV